MKILFDQGVPVPLAQELPGLEITTAYRQGWSNLNNGALLKAAEAAGLTVLITTDRTSAISRISRSGALPSRYCRPRAGSTSSRTRARSGMHSLP